MPRTRRCVGKTKSGERCRNQVAHGDRCYAHPKQAPADRDARIVQIVSVGAGLLAVIDKVLPYLPQLADYLGIVLQTGGLHRMTTDEMRIFLQKGRTQALGFFARNAPGQTDLTSLPAALRSDLEAACARYVELGDAPVGAGQDYSGDLHYQELDAERRFKELLHKEGYPALVERVRAAEKTGAALPVTLFVGEGVFALLGFLEDKWAAHEKRPARRPEDVYRLMATRTVSECRAEFLRDPRWSFHFRRIWDRVCWEELLVEGFWYPNDRRDEFVPDDRNPFRTSAEANLSLREAARSSYHTELRYLTELRDLFDKRTDTDVRLAMLEHAEATYRSNPQAVEMTIEESAVLLLEFSQSKWAEASGLAAGSWTAALERWILWELRSIFDSLLHYPENYPFYQPIWNQLCAERGDKSNAVHESLLFRPR